MVYLTMNKFLAFLLTLTSFAIFAQEPCGHHEMILRDAVNDTSFVRRTSAFSNTSRSTFEQKTIPVIVHIFYQGEDYGEGSHLTQEIVIEAIDHLNQVFSGLTEDENDTFINFCISNETLTGEQAFGILYHNLNDYEPYDGSLGNITDDNFYIGLQNTYGYSVSNYMEIFVAPWISGYTGFTSVPPSNLGIWIRTNRFGFGEHITNSNNQNTTLSHEVGHWCGLYHIFAENSWGGTYSTCEEATLEENCSSQGDKVCDTNPCYPTFGCSPSCNEPFGNMMGYYLGTCRFGFTLGQIERMHDQLEFWRPQHFENSFCEGTETGCTDIEACNYDFLALYEDGSCVYADPGYDCFGSPIVNIQELIENKLVKDYSYYDTMGRIIDINYQVKSGIYMLRIEYHNGTCEVIKVYIDGNN